MYNVHDREIHHTSIVEVHFTSLNCMNSLKTTGFIEKQVHVYMYVKIKANIHVHTYTHVQVHVHVHMYIMHTHTSDREAHP